MSRTEKILPIILSLVLPGLNFASNTIVAEVPGLPQILAQYLLGSGFLYSLWYIDRYFTDHPFSDRLGIWGTLIIVNMVWILLFMLLFVLLLPEEYNQAIRPRPVMAIIRLAIGAMVYALIQSGLRAQKNQEALKVQNLSLQAENLKSQLEVMKQQINPHFLFNSLNTLLDLIEDDQQKAAAFVRSFSKLYRSVLQTSQQDFVLVEDELRLLDNYWALLKMRFHDAVALHIDISASRKSWLIPPLSLQLLIENAVKHNQATAKKVLHIEIKEVGDNLVVQNKINPKAFQEAGEGVGLSNLQQRYALLHEPIRYGVEADQFIVTLPLKPAR